MEIYCINTNWSCYHSETLNPKSPIRSFFHSLAKALATMKSMTAMKMRKTGSVHFCPFVILVTKAPMVIFCNLAKGNSIPMQKTRPNVSATVKFPRNRETFERRL